MPSTRRQKAKARKSREMDMMSDFENMEVVLGSDSVNPIERELSNVIGNTESHCDNESNLQSGEDDSHVNGFGHYVHENMIPRQDRFQETMESFTSEFNMRLSEEMDSMMSMMHNQINRAIRSAIAERVIPQIQNIVSSMSSSGYRDTEVSSSPNSQENTEGNKRFKAKIAKKDSRSAVDLRDNRDSSTYTWVPRKHLIRKCKTCKIFVNKRFTTTLNAAVNHSTEKLLLKQKTFHASTRTK